MVDIGNVLTSVPHAFDVKWVHDQNGKSLLVEYVLSLSVTPIQYCKSVKN